MIKVEVKINGVYTLVDIVILEKTEKGLFANNYNIDGSIDIISEQKEVSNNELQSKINEAQQYLNNTDWYFARKAETGEEVPEDVVLKRAESRKFIQDNKGVN